MDATSGAIQVMTIWWKPFEKMPKEWEWVSVQWMPDDGIVWYDPFAKGDCFGNVLIGRARYSHQYGWVPVNKHYHVFLWAENP
jgi:hypothetical protein